MRHWSSPPLKSQTRRQRKSHERRSAYSFPANICLQVVDACHVGIIFLVPLLLGGRHSAGRFVFVALAGLAAAAWLTRQALLDQAKWPLTKAYTIGLAAIALVAVQLIPLPPSWIDQLTPRNSSLLPLWSSDTAGPVQFGGWPTLSLAPHVTKIALATLVAYVLLFITAIERLQTLNDIQRLLRLIACSAIFMGSFGLIQYFTSNGLFFWFYELPYTGTDRAAKGGFTCSNHFAHFLALGMAPLLAWIVLRVQQKKQSTKEPSTNWWPLDIALCLGLLLIVLGVLLSLSRGGALALAIASILGLVIYYRHGFITNSSLYGLGILAILIVAILSLNGYDRVAGRLDDFVSGSLENLDHSSGRRKIWDANLAAVEQGGFFGAGAGSHREIYPVYLPESLNIEYTHAENGYLQIATECGYLGTVLLMITLATVSRWCWQALRHAESVSQLVAATAVTSALVASAVHSFVDFIWFIPACMSLTILLAATAYRLALLAKPNKLQDEQSTLWSRSTWSGLAITASLAAVWAGSITIGPARAAIYWDRYLLASHMEKKQQTKSLMTLKSNFHEQKPIDNQSRIKAAIFNLQRVLFHHPNSSRANLRLAGKYLQLFNTRQNAAENSMSIDQIRDAAIASQFSSGSELRQWLQRAFGKNSELLYRAYYHTQKSLRLCPLQGEGYLYLANLCFLNGHDGEATNAYVAQSIKVRPYDGKVLFEAGRQALLLGEVTEALHLWKQVFLDRGPHQLQTIRLLAGNFPASAFLEHFRPDWHVLPYVWQWYNQVGSEADRRSIVDYAELAAVRESSQYPASQMVSIWRSLARMQQALNRQQQALNSYTHAFELAPSEYRIRREFGHALLVTQHYRLAEHHLRWCFARKSNDAKLRKDLATARNGHIAQTSRESVNYR